MPETTKRAGVPWVQGLMFVIAVGAVLWAVWMSMNRGGKVDITFEREGLGTVKVAAEGKSVPFADVLTEALGAKDPSVVTAILASKGFFRPNDPRLVPELARLDPSDREDERAVTELRKLLWRLENPFGLPDTLIGADEGFLRALDELEISAKKNGVPHKLLAEISWRSLERSGVFRPRALVAVVELAPRAAAPGLGGQQFYACPGNPLVGKTVTIVSGRSPQLPGEITQDVFVLDCGGESGPSFQMLLAGSELRLGVDPETYAELADPSGISAPLPDSIRAKFQIDANPLKPDRSPLPN